MCATTILEHQTMEEVTTASRKDDHIRINIERDVQFKSISNGLDKLYFNHNALPELNLDDVDTNVTILGKNAAILIIPAAVPASPSSKVKRSAIQH